MTLTELRYIVALAQERHFGHAAEKCFVTQPTLSLAIKKLEEELGLMLFERNKSEVIVTAAGEAIVAQAKRVLEEANRIYQLARAGGDPLSGPLRLGVIPTIGPYLLPELVPLLRKAAPNMPLSIEENLTGNLAPMLRQGEIDAALIALPFVIPGVKTRMLYEESFRVVVPNGHPWGKRKKVKPSELGTENLLMLNTGHCFRDQVLEACPGQAPDALTDGRAGSSLETIRAMVASGLGVSVLPCSALGKPYQTRSVHVLEFDSEIPSRKVALAWREGFGRAGAIDVLANAVKAVNLPCLKIKA
ncbi:MAG: LysR substrate-binding domain-containing protein [Burkholderiales bacterium]|nr:LysR substrate-binding domain-containing protein [Burkholderiales bacterium]